MLVLVRRDPSPALVRTDGPETSCHHTRSRLIMSCPLRVSAVSGRLKSADVSALFKKYVNIYLIFLTIFFD